MHEHWISKGKTYIFFWYLWWILNSPGWFKSCIEPAQGYLTIAKYLIQCMSIELAKKILEDAIKLYQKEMKKREILHLCNVMWEDEEESNEWLSIANNKINL